MAKDINTTAIAAESDISTAMEGMVIEPTNQASMDEVEQVEYGDEYGQVVYPTVFSNSEDAASVAKDIGSGVDNEHDSASKTGATLPSLDIDTTSKLLTMIYCKVLSLITLVPSRPELWNLTGHDPNDPAHNILTEAQWYGWEEQMASFREELVNSSSIRRILDESGREQEE